MFLAETVSSFSRTADRIQAANNFNVNQLRYEPKAESSARDQVIFDTNKIYWVLHNPHLTAEGRDRLLMELFGHLLGIIRRIPGFADILGVEVDRDVYLLENGHLISRGQISHVGRMLSLKEVNQLAGVK